MEPKGGHNFKFDGQGPNDPDYPQEAEQMKDERGSSTQHQQDLIFPFSLVFTNLMGEISTRIS